MGPAVPDRAIRDCRLAAMQPRILALQPSGLVLVAAVLAAVIAAAVAATGIGIGLSVAGAAAVFIIAGRERHARPDLARVGRAYGSRCPACLLLWLAHRDGSGPATLLWILAIVWATDIGAYGFGSQLGGPRLAPRWSPRKTWAGLLGGIFCAALVGWATARLLGGSAVLPLVMLSAGLAIVGQFGDLAEFAGQEKVRREGFERSDPRPWRPSRPARWIAGRHPGGGAPDCRSRRQRAVLGMTLAIAAATAGEAARQSDSTPTEIARADRWPRRVSILGSTGSIGRSTVDLLLRNRDLFTVEALTANHNAALLAEQARALDARFAAVADPADYPALKEALAGTGIEMACGRAALVEAAERPADWVMAGIVGAAGLEPTLAAVRQGRMVAFANKEVLVSRRQPVHARGRGARRDAAAGRQRAQCDLAVLRLFQGGPDRENYADLQRRPVPRAQLRAHARRDPGPGGGAPDMEHGGKNFGRLGHLDEQGARADRGVSPLSAAGRAHRYRHPSAIDRAWPRDLLRRLGAGPSWLARHAHPDRLRAGLARTQRRPRPSGSISPRSDA